MLECNRYLRRKVTLLKCVLAFALPAILILLLLAQIAFAKNTYRIHDGGRVTVYTTYATDPAVVLDEAGLQLNAEDTYVTQVIAGVSEITIQRKQQVRIVMGGKELVACTYGETVGALLDRLGIQLAEEDILSEKRSSFTYDGMTVTISRGITRQEQNTVTIPFTTEYCYDASIPEGQQVVLTAGSDGQATQIVSGISDHIGMSNIQTFQHLVYVILRLIDNFLHDNSSLKSLKFIFTILSGPAL